MKSPNVTLYSKWLKCVYEDGEIKLHEYSPKWNRLLMYHFEPIRFVRYARFMLDFLKPGRYKVYYLSFGDELVAHCVITPGGRRLKCSSVKDIVVGPYFVKEEERKKGYGKMVIHLTLDHCSYSYRSAYAWIDKKNTASVSAAEACGFVRHGELDIVGFARKLEIVHEGEDWIYRYDRRR